MQSVDNKQTTEAGNKAAKQKRLKQVWEAITELYTPGDPEWGPGRGWFTPMLGPTGEDVKRLVELEQEAEELQRSLADD